MNALKKNHLLYFFFKTGLLVLVLFLLDRGFGKILNNFYFKQKTGELSRITYVMEDSKEDILIFGSSRAYHHYHPEVFKQKLNYSIYNTGSDGQHILYQYALLKSVLSRYSPKVVVVDFIAKEFDNEKRSYDRISRLLPYYQRHPEIREILNLRGPYEKYKLMSRIYPYNSEVLQIMLGRTKSREEEQNVVQGYVPLYHQVQGKMAEITYPGPYTIDTVKLNIFEEFIHDCKQAGTQLYIVCSPYYQHATNEEYSVLRGKEIAAKYNVPFIDFSNSADFYTHADLFADPGHLNDKGARIFTEKLIDSIINKDGNSPLKLALR